MAPSKHSWLRPRKRERLLEHATMTYIWHGAYKAAILETDCTKLQERLQSAESATHERQHTLSMDHGGTPEEREAIADALNGMRVLRREVAEWKNPQVSDREH